MASDNADDPTTRLKLTLSNVYMTGEYSDLIVRCSNGDEYKCHRLALCAQSAFFQRACNPKYGFKETLSGIIELQNDEPDVVRAMLEWIYTFTYTCKPSDGPEKRMLFHVQVYAVADIYDIPGLKALAVSSFERDADHKSALFPEAVRAVYESTPESDRGLRDVVLRVCVEHATDLLCGGGAGGDGTNSGIMSSNARHNRGRGRGRGRGGSTSGRSSSHRSSNSNARSNTTYSNSGSPQAFQKMMDSLGVFGRELARALAQRAPAAPAPQRAVVACTKYRCVVCRRVCTMEIPERCNESDLIYCMFCDAAFSVPAWKGRKIADDEPAEEDGGGDGGRDGRAEMGFEELRPGW